MFAIHSKQHRVRGAAWAIVVAGVSSNGAWGAVIHTKAVRVNEVAVAPTSYVVVNPGDQVDIEFYASGWAGEIDTVRTWQASVDSAGYFSGERGVLMPLGWDAPPAGRPCQTDEDCTGGICGRLDKCAFAACVTDADCVAPFTCKQLSSTYWCLGVDHAPESGGSIDAEHPESIFGGISNVVSAVDTSTLGYRFGATLFLDDGPADDGGMYYLCTLRLVVSDDARGVFTVGASYPPFTFLSDPSYVDAPLVLQPVTIDAGSDAALEPGACCRGLRGCENLLQSECTEQRGFWQRGQACGVGTQSCVGARPLRPTAQD